MRSNSEKYTTKYVIIEHGKETISKKAYNSSPYTLIKREEQEKLTFSFIYVTNSKELFFSAIGFSLLIDIPYIVISVLLTLIHDFIEIFLISLVVMFFLTLSVFIVALFVGLDKKSKSCEYLFDKEENLFTKSKISSDFKKRMKFTYKISEINNIGILSQYEHYPAIHYRFAIYIRIKNKKRVNFFKIHRNVQQIVDYCRLLRDFLGVEIRFPTRSSKKVFREVFIENREGKN